MFHRLMLTATGLAALAAPGLAQAQTVGQQVNLGSTVVGACGLGAPTVTEINLGDLTGGDGKLDPGKTGTATLQSTTIPNAWCNAPHTLTFAAKAMSLTHTLPYAQPAYMARDVTYNARLSGWPSIVTRRPLSGDDIVTLEQAGAFAAPGAGLTLAVSRLQTLTAGKAEQAGLMLEVGTYRGTVTITLAALN